MDFIRLKLFSIVFKQLFKNVELKRLALAFELIEKTSARVTYKLVQKGKKSIKFDLAIEFLMNNIEKKLAKQVKFVLRSAFCDVRLYSRLFPQFNRKKFEMLVKRFSREQNQAFSAFHVLKKNAINSKLRSFMIDSGKQRASIMRIMFILLKPLNFVFNLLKHHRKVIVLLPVPVEFALFASVLIFQKSLNESLFAAFKSIRFVAKVKTFMSSKKLKAKVYLIVKNLNKIAIRSFRGFLQHWNKQSILTSFLLEDISNDVPLPALENFE